LPVDGLIYLLIQVFGYVVPVTVGTTIITVIDTGIGTTGIIAFFVSQKGIYYGTGSKRRQ
jgi:hypothetical protein